MRNLADLVKKSGHSVKEVADGSGIDLTRLHKILTGESPKLNELRNLARFLKMDLSGLAVESSESPNVMLFRNTMGGSFRRNQELTVEILSNHLDRTMELLSTSIGENWLDSLPSVSLDTYEGAERLAEQFRTQFFD